jgi:ribosome biogenesis protein YTM1
MPDTVSSVQANTTENGQQIQVRFKSRKESLAVPTDPILVPTRLKRFGLSEIINHLLGTGEFD